MPQRRRASSAPGSSRRRAGAGPARGRSTTRRTTRVTQPDSQEAAAASRAKLTGRAAILLLVVAVLSVSYASSVRAWIHQRGEINTLSADIADRQATIEALRLEKKRWNDPAYVETQARLRFGWLMPGETGYRVIGADGEVLEAGEAELSAPADIAETGEVEWWDTAWGSVEEAGKTREEVAAEVAAEAPPQRAPQRIGPKTERPGGR